MQTSFTAICLEGTKESTERTLRYIQLAIMSVPTEHLSVTNPEDIEYQKTLHHLYMQIEGKLSGEDNLPPAPF